MAVPDHLVAEIIDGELYTSPRPSLPHADASSGLGGDLIGPFDRGRGGPGGWWILYEPELHLGPDIIVPDLAGWRRSRLPAVPREPYLTMAPDWVRETISPSTESLDRGKKLRVYAREGVGHLWLPNPARSFCTGCVWAHCRRSNPPTSWCANCCRVALHKGRW